MNSEDSATVATLSDETTDEQPVVEDHSKRLRLNTAIPTGRHWSWAHFVALGDYNTSQRRYDFVKCCYCKNKVVGRTDSKMPDHLLLHCKSIEEDQKDELRYGVGHKYASTRPVRQPKTGNNCRKRKIDEGQNTMTQFFDTKALTKDEEEEFSLAVLRFIVHSASSFRLLSDPYFVHAFKLIRPAFVLPSRGTLLQGLFSKEYWRVWYKLRDTVQTKTGYTLMADGWTDSGNKSYLGMILTKRGEYPIPIDLVDITDTRHTSVTLRC